MNLKTAVFRVKRILLAIAVCVLPSTAATTAVWEMNSYNDFIRGKLIGLSLNRDGKLDLVGGNCCITSFRQESRRSPWDYGDREAQRARQGAFPQARRR